MIFKSRQVNLDPAPWARVAVGTGSVLRHGTNVLGACQFAPRLEFEATRDPEPWIDVLGTRWPAQPPEGWIGHWAPRRGQFDTPVNPILTAYRHDLANLKLSRTPLEWLEDETDPVDLFDPYTPEQVDHARRVLSRLAALGGVQ